MESQLTVTEYLEICKATAHQIYNINTFSNSAALLHSLLTTAVLTILNDPHALK